MYLPRLFIAVLYVMPIAPLAAHEFWIEPDAYQVMPGDSIRANFKNGQNFEGSTLAYLDRRSTRFEIMMNGNVSDISARSGDIPAVQFDAPDNNALLVVIHETTPSSLTYTEWEKFMKFIEHKNFTTAAADHTAAGWPKQRFKENYTRHVKALIALGNGRGSDAAVGMLTEFVALTNPYEDKFDGAMRVALFYGDAPRANAQVEVFDRAPDGTVAVTLHRTDTAGEAEILVKAGHEYLFDAVVLRPAPNAGTDPDAPVWETLWAALTFAVPAQ